MRKFLLLLLIIYSCSGNKDVVRKVISLAGEWQFRIDSLDKGLQEKWYDSVFTETVKLPGSMAENGKGNDVSLKTEWTGDIIDRSFFNDKRYEKYRQPGNFKVPFWLQPVKYYKGAAWYQKEFEYSSEWESNRVILSLERPHWETTVFVNGRKAGSENSLAVAHKYDITDFLTKGKNKLSIRIDNRMVVPVGVNSHSVSDHTQSNWNGITGDISLNTVPAVYIEDVAVYPDAENNTAKVIVTIKNKSGKGFNGSVILGAQLFNTSEKEKIRSKKVPASSDAEEFQILADYSLGKRFHPWSEFSPALYNLSASLRNETGQEIQSFATNFGMREFKAEGTRFSVNGNEIFIRGTLECCIFPITGYPPTDIESWTKVLSTCREYGLNAIRFHSWCPPEAAFKAADRLGMYFHIECSSWANQGTQLGEGGAIDDYIYAESDRILKAYGNHPSFCMLAYGNEPAGKKQSEYLGNLISYWKSKDNRRVYTSAAGWPFIPENDYNLSPEPRIQRWGEGLNSIINGVAPQTMFDYRDYVQRFRIPVVSHEIGQWCVYPDLKEIEKYKGVLKARNFEIFKESLEESGMGDLAEKFLMASGKLQALCYKADIEAALRTPGFAGFNLLQLHDFPGQGSALVGILNPFFESKGYITPDEFRMFCNSIVPLARLPKHVYRNNEMLDAGIEIANFGPSEIENGVIACRLITTNSDTLFTKRTEVQLIERGNCIPLGSLNYRFENFTRPEKLRIDVYVEGTQYHNSWDIWVYPEEVRTDPGKVYLTEKLDAATESILNAGGSVLYLPYGKIAEGRGKEVAIGFSSIFWNTAWTNNQPPHTLGILCDPKHPAFGSFPTEYHSNWQWWDPVSHSQAMRLDDFPASLKPIIQPIDDWFKNRKLALAFEAKVGGGKMVVCSIDMKNITEDRIVSRQLLSSILEYMNSQDFSPVTEIDLDRIKNLSVNK
jgi:hypothetical protein